jgi:hypothetical protein
MLIVLSVIRRGLELGHEALGAPKLDHAASS